MLGSTLRKTLRGALIVPPTAICVLLSSSTGAAAPKLEGTWRLAELRIDRVKGQTAAGPVIETERRNPEADRESVTIGASDDVITTVTWRAHGPGATDRYVLDNQPHVFEWGDTLPRETPVRVGRLTADADGFELTETYWRNRRQQHLWTVSPTDGS